MSGMWTPQDQANVRRWAAAPHLFVREAIGATPHRWQDEELQAAPSLDRMAIAGSKGCAKTTLWAWLIWWHLFCFYKAKAVATSGSRSQLRDTLWAELAKWQTPILKRAFHWSSQRIVVRGSDELQGQWWASARTWNKDADEHTQGQALAGLHGHPALMILDEAGSIPPSLLVTADAVLATKKPGQQVLVCMGGNTTSTRGALYAAATKLRGLWSHYRRITSDPDDPNRTPNVSEKYARELIKTYGRDNPFVKINVFAEFPDQELGKLLSLAELEDAAGRKVEEDFRQPLVMGVDVGTVADAAVIYLRRGRLLHAPVVMRGQSTVAIASKVVELARELNVTAVFIDAGGPGIGVIDQCRALGLRVVPVFFGGKADDGVRYGDKRIEMYERAATWIKEGGAIDAGTSTELIQDMVEPDVGWHLKGHKVLEPKDEIKKRLQRSTDWGDAFALTFAYPVAPPATPDVDPRLLGRRMREPWAPQQTRHDEFGFGGWHQERGVWRRGA